MYSSVIADTIQRWHRLLNPNVQIRFATGTDEHGSKIQQAAAKFKIKPDQYCEEISKLYKNLADNFSISYTDFIRTSSDEHEIAVKEFWVDIFFVISFLLIQYHCRRN